MNTHVDKREIVLYTNKGVLKVVREKINKTPLMSIYFNSKLELVLKTAKNGTMVYYDSEEDLSVYLNDNINYSDLDSNSVLIYNLEDDIANFEHIDNVNNLIDFFSLSKEKKKSILKYFNIGNPFEIVHKDMVIQTSIGELTVKKNSKEFPEGMMVYFNGSPIVLIEESYKNNKLILKKYNNSKVIQDDSYINSDAYDFEPIDEFTIMEILKNIEE